MNYMETTRLTTENYDFIVELTQKMIQKNAPEEADIVKEIIKQTYQPYRDRDVKTQGNVEQKYSFVGLEDITGFTSAALGFLLPRVVFPLFRKVWEELLDKTAEKSVDEMIIKFKNLLTKLQNKKKNKELQHQVDLLIPINWQEMEHTLRKVALENGFPSRIADKATNILISELSEDRILLGNTVIYVNRKSLSSEASQNLILY